MAVKKQKSYTKELELEMYPISIVLHVGQDLTSLAEYLNDYYPQDIAMAVLNHIPTHTAGRFVYAVNNDNRDCYLIYLKEIPTRASSFSVVVHEATHATLKIMENLGILLNMEDIGEAYCYLNQYITFKLLQELWK